MANATYKSDIITLNQPARLGTAGVQWIFGQVDIPLHTVLATTDVIQLCLIPSNSILIPQIQIDLPDLDAGTQLVLQLSDNSNATSGGIIPSATTQSTSAIVYIASITTGQAGGLISGVNATGSFPFAHDVIGTQYQQQQILQLVPTTAAQTQTAADGVIYFGCAFQTL